MSIRKTMFSWYALFLLGLWCASPCAASGNLEKFDRLGNNMNLLLHSVQSYQSSLKQAGEELRTSRQQLTEAKKESQELRKELTMSQAECDRMRQLLETANASLKSSAKTMKAKINKERWQKRGYAVVATCAIIYAKHKTS